tara:strand:+ start:89 stop:2485 length:2397 start_codon:yes stop_codon:yes gene_type:complete
MRRVQIKGTNQTIGFPDEMDEEQMLQVMRSQFSQPAPAGQNVSDALKPRQAYAQGYEPTLPEQIKNKIGGALYDSGIISDRYGAQRIGDNISMMAEALPVVGDAVGGDDFGRALQQGNTADMLLAGVGAVPVVGAGLKVGGKALTSKLKEGIDFKLGDVNPKADYDFTVNEADYVDPQELVGKSISWTLADQLDAGRVYKGVDSSKLDEAQPLTGGQLFPQMKYNEDAGVVWAANTAAQVEAMQKSDYVIVSNMAQDAHKSNVNTNINYFDTLRKYVDDGRIDGFVQDDIIDKLRNTKITKKGVTSTPFDDIPNNATSADMETWLQSKTFDIRGTMADKLKQFHSKDNIAKYGKSPMYQKVLDESADQTAMGYNKGDGYLVLRVDKGDEAVVELGTEGTTPNKSYRFGVKGKVVGKLPMGARMENMFPTKVAEKLDAGKDPIKNYRAFQGSIPVDTFTQELADTIGSKPLNYIKSPKQARMLNDFVQGNWKPSDKNISDGGSGAAGFSRALMRSKGSATLTPYSIKELNKMNNSGAGKFYQLGDADAWFGLRNGHDYQTYGIDLDAAGILPNEKQIFGVVNNEVGSRGAAVTPMMLKAIGEGATILDAYDVKSTKFPDGFLPSLYNEFGFTEAARVPYNTDFDTDLQLADKKEFWKKSGWTEDQGLPDLVVMKWRGTDEQRKSIEKDFIESAKRGDVASFITRAAEQYDSTARKVLRGDGGQNATEISGSQSASNTRDVLGGIRAGDGAARTFRDGNVIQELEKLTDAQRYNLGLSNVNPLLNKPINKTQSGTKFKIE